MSLQTAAGSLPAPGGALTTEGEEEEEEEPGPAVGGSAQGSAQDQQEEVEIHGQPLPYCSHRAFFSPLSVCFPLSSDFLF